MAKTNFKNFVLKKDATGSFESVKQKRGHGDGHKKPKPIREILEEIQATLKEHSEIFKRNNLK